MKTLRPYRVKSAYGVYRKGDIIYPTGMLRDELIMCGRIEPVPEPVVVPEPAPEPEPAPVEDISDDEPDPLVETATEPEPETAARGYGRRSRR
jgi:hypothetical protein